MKIKEHIKMGNSVKKCKFCHTLIIPRYFGDIRCEACDKMYMINIHKILNAS